MIKVLGSYGNRGKGEFTTSFLIREDIVIDAGNLTNGLGNDVNKVNHIFLSHSHFDHIVDIPFIIDNNFENRVETIKIYGLKETLNAIKEIFDNKIWPDFTKIKLLNSKPAIEFVEITESQEIVLDDITLKTIKSNHTVPTLGYKITKNNQSVIISGDTYLNDVLVEEINNTDNLKLVLLEVSFPSRLEELAKTSKHLTPALVKQFKQKITKNVKIFFYHFKAEYKSEIVNELMELDLVRYPYQILNDGTCIHVFTKEDCKTENDNFYKTELRKLMKIGVELSYQQNIDYLLEDILSVAREFTQADGGSMYLKKGDKLYFKIVQNDTLNTFMGGRHKEIEWPPLDLYINGEENKNMVAALCALTQKSFNIPDVYLNHKFDFSGTKKFDKTTGYRSKSMLVIPLINHKKETIGVLQLINKKDDKYIIPFSKHDEEITMSLASQAAVSITKNKLINDLEDFIESFIRVIAKAVDEKSKYTGNHVQKVAILAELLSKEINKDKEFFKDIKYDKKMLNQIKIAALLHDIGKITTDPTIMDKSTKLEKVVDRIDIVAERFEIIKRNMLLQGIDDFYEIEKDLEFLKQANIGGEYMSDDKIAKIDEIANKYYYILGDKKVSILREDEIEMLKIKKGTLSDEEREHINRHALMTLEMLSGLPFPNEYSEVTHIAANHHEKLNCKGYPRGLCEKDLTLEDRLLAICDIFEALTASDRPYKTPKKLSEVFKIMGFMAKDGEIDENLYKFFIEKEIWKKYKKHLLKEQLDV
jgi:HD-GYP domain-containing protein (c-di-GMP phosphodiesterase class II)/ribonuclease BN (tRNA processing enzyme)